MFNVILFKMDKLPFNNLLEHGHIIDGMKRTHYRIQLHVNMEKKKGCINLNNTVLIYVTVW